MCSVNTTQQEREIDAAFIELYDKMADPAFLQSLTLNNPQITPHNNMSINPQQTSHDPNTSDDLSEINVDLGCTLRTLYR
jgi:hypothetical protein